MRPPELQQNTHVQPGAGTWQQQQQQSAAAEEAPPKSSAANAHIVVHAQLQAGARVAWGGAQQQGRTAAEGGGWAGSDSAADTQVEHGLVLGAEPLLVGRAACSPVNLRLLLVGREEAQQLAHVEQLLLGECWVCSGW